METSFDGRHQATQKFEQFRFNYLKHFPQPAAASRVLDIGIGRGEMLTCMKDWGFAYRGVDISPSTAATYCRSISRCPISGVRSNIG